MTGLAFCTGHLLRRHGGAATLRRRVGTTPAFTEAAVACSTRGFAPEELVGGVRQGDLRAVVGVPPASFGAPRNGDFLVADGRTFAVLGAFPRAVGGRVVGHDLHLRGG